MGRINWFRLEHQAFLIEMNSFPFPNGHFLSRRWMGRGGCSLPIADPHGAVQLGCSEPAVIAVPFNPLSIWEGAHGSPLHAPCSDALQTLYLQLGWGVQVPNCLSPLKRIERCMPGSLAGHLGSTKHCDACCFLWARGAAGGWSQEMRVPRAERARLVCMQDSQGCCELCAWNKTTLYPCCCLPCSQSYPGFAAAPGRLLSWPHRRRGPRWVSPDLEG